MLELLITPPDMGRSALAGMHAVHQLAGFMWCTVARACSECGEDTQWVDLGFEVPLCPGVCSQKAWDDYEWAELMLYLNSPQHQALVESLRTGFNMRCPNVDCRPPRYCGLCNGTGQIP